MSNPNNSSLLVVASKSHRDQATDDYISKYAVEDMKSLFVPFFTTKRKGTGLGLAICQRAVETMGGQLMLMPAAPDEGARFRLEFSSDGDPEA